MTFDPGQDPIAQRSGSLMRKTLIILAPIFILVFFVIATNLILKANAEPEEKERKFNALAVMADYARAQDVQLSVETQGEARPRTEIDLVPQVGGKIVYVSPNFIEGGIFKKGETLIRLEDADFRVAEIRAAANVAQAEQVLVREIAEGQIAKQDYAELGSGGPSALALRDPQRKQAEAALSAAKADLENARLQLTRTYVRAPFDGRVRSKQSDLGQFVGPGSRLGSIFSTDIVQVRLPLTDADLTKLDLPIAYFAQDPASAPNVELSAVVAGKRRVWNAKIMRTDSAYDTQTRALFAIAEVFDPYGEGASEGGVPLAPGLFVNAKIKGKSFENVIVMPRDGLRPGNEVYIIDDKGKAEVRNVEVLDADSGRAVILSGVAANEIVLLSPMERSRIEMTLRAMDINSPSVVLVEPPKPEWLIAAEKKKAEKEAAAKDAPKKKSFFGFGSKDKPKETEAAKEKRPLKKSDKPAESSEATTEENSETESTTSSPESETAEKPER